VKNEDIKFRTGINKVDLSILMVYYSSMMKVDNKIVQEADNLAKETHLPFRDCLEILYKAYLKSDGLPYLPLPQNSRWKVPETSWISN